MVAFLNVFTGTGIGEYIIIISYITIIILIIMLLMSLPRLVDQVFDINDKVMFKIYSKRSGSFRVDDFTRGFRKKINFKTYIDVQAYVLRRVNGWDINNYKLENN